MNPQRSTWGILPTVSLCVALGLPSTACRRSQPDRESLPIAEPLRSFPAPSARAVDAPLDPVSPASKDWVLVRTDNDLFEVEMPNTPSERRLASGQVLLEVSDPTNGRFKLTVADTTPDPSLAGKPQLVLDASQKGLLASLGPHSSPLARQDLTVSGNPARKLSFAASGSIPAQAYLMCFAKKRYLYVLRHVGPKEAGERFLASFKVIDHPGDPTQEEPGK
jgi:hypothetical protein